MIGGKKKGAEETKKEEAKKEEIKFDPITPETLMVGKQFGKANKKFAKVVVTYSLFSWFSSLEGGRGVSLYANLLAFLRQLLLLVFPVFMILAQPDFNSHTL